MGVPLSQSMRKVPCQKTHTSWFMATFIGFIWWFIPGIVFSMVFHGFPWFSHGFPLVFPWFSHNFEVRNPDFLWICGLSWSHRRRKQQLRRPRRRQRVWPRCAGLWRTWGRMWWSLSYIYYIYIIYMYYNYIILYITLCTMYIILYIIYSWYYIYVLYLYRHAKLWLALIIGLLGLKPYTRSSGGGGGRIMDWCHGRKRSKRERGTVKRTHETGISWGYT